MQPIDEYLKTNLSLRKMVVCYLLSGDGKVLLGLRKQVSLGLGQNLIAGIGGKVGDLPGLENETAEEALKREVQEEIGVDVKSYSLVGQVTFLFPAKPKWNQIVDVFIITAWSGKPNETEAIKPIWYRIDDLPNDQMWDDSKYWLPRVLAGKRINDTFLYGEDNATVVDKQIKD